VSDGLVNPKKSVSGLEGRKCLDFVGMEMGHIREASLDGLDDFNRES
jgi:hypothetical protein